MTMQAEQVVAEQQRLEWYQQARFGMFIHWGVYSVAGVEASWPIMAPDLAEVLFGTKTRISEAGYVKLPERFNPLDFDPDAWVRIAKQAGMRYMVITAKHHDGFCMFDAPGTDYKITNTPFGRDVCLELAQACARAGMPLGFYYSPPDMRHPGYRDTSKPATKNWTGEPQRKQWGEYLDYMESHLRKLLTDYGEVSIIWFDGLANHGKYDPQRFHDLIHELSPGTLINDRLGDDADFVTPEQFIPQKGIPARTGKPVAGLAPGGDGFFRLVCALFELPGIRGWMRKQLQKYADGTLELTPVHQELYPAPERFQPWETCMTMGQTWAFNPMESNWKAPGTLLRNLVEVTSRGGNYLLNVGPTARGAFPPEAVERLEYVGRWMDQYSESIYGTTYTPLNGSSWGRATRKGAQLFLHVFEWPASGRLEVEPFPGAAHQVSQVGGGKLEFSQSGEKLEITLPQSGQDADVSVLVVEIDPTEKGWSAYSAPSILTIPPQKYLKDQAVSSGVVNAVLNGLIALASYAGQAGVSFAAAAVDVLVTVFIISFLTGWILVGSARSEYAKGNLARLAAKTRGLELPRGAALRGLVIGLACTVLFGGLFLNGLTYLFSPAGFSNWAYIVFKTLYTSASGILGASLAIQSVIDDENRS